MTRRQRVKDQVEVEVEKRSRRGSTDVEISFLELNPVHVCDWTTSSPLWSHVLKTVFTYLKTSKVFIFVEVEPSQASRHRTNAFDMRDTIKNISGCTPKSKGLLGSIHIRIGQGLPEQ